MAGIDASPAINSGMVDRWSADVGSGVIRVAGIDASPVLDSGLVNESVLTVTDVIGSAGDSAVTGT